MSKEFFACKGNKHFIIDSSAGNGFSFTDLGAGIEEVTSNYIISMCGNTIKEVDVISFLGSSVGNISDIYFNGKHLTIKEKVLNAYRMIPSSINKYSNIIYRIPRDDLEMGLLQILLLYPKGVLNFNILSKIYGNIKL